MTTIIILEMYLVKNDGFTIESKTIAIHVYETILSYKQIVVDLNHLMI